MVAKKDTKRGAVANRKARRAKTSKNPPIQEPQPQGPMLPADRKTIFSTAAYDIMYILAEAKGHTLNYGEPISVNWPNGAGRVYINSDTPPTPPAKSKIG